MSDETVELPELEIAIARVYRGPLEEFVSRRDALAKQLRASGRREDADAMKALRKPSRVAWTLDNAVLTDADAIDSLAQAIGAAVESQSSGSGDLRAALESVRTAVREFAEAAAQAADAAGQRSDALSLVPAVLAVMGDSDAFAALRAGRLAEIPEGGALDFLNAGVATGPPAEAVGEVTQDTDDAAATLENAELEQAETSLVQARERAGSAQQAL